MFFTILDFNLPPDTSTTGHFSTLTQPLQYFWNNFTALLQLHVGHLQPRRFIFQCHNFLPFHTVLGVPKARMLNWLAIPFSSGPHFVRTLHLYVLCGPKGMVQFH